MPKTQFKNFHFAEHANLGDGNEVVKPAYSFQFSKLQIPIHQPVVISYVENNKKLSLHEDQWACQKNIPLNGVPANISDHGTAKIQNLRVCLTNFSVNGKSETLYLF